VTDRRAARTDRDRRRQRLERGGYDPPILGDEVLETIAQLRRAESPSALEAASRRIFRGVRRTRQRVGSVASRRPVDCCQSPSNARTRLDARL
jgi:hypothetical protein